MSSDSPGTDGRGPGGDPRPGADAPRRIAERWRRFAREAAGRSPAYVEVCHAVADSPFVLDFLAAMPEAKWQPNVLLGVVRYLYGTPSTGAEFVALVGRPAATPTTGPD